MFIMKKKLPLNYENIILAFLKYYNIPYEWSKSNGYFTGHSVIIPHPTTINRYALCLHEIGHYVTFLEDDFLNRLLTIAEINDIWIKPLPKPTKKTENIHVFWQEIMAWRWAWEHTSIYFPRRQAKSGLLSYYFQNGVKDYFRFYESLDTIFYGQFGLFQPNFSSCTKAGVTNNKPWRNHAYCTTTTSRTSCQGRCRSAR